MLPVRFHSERHKAVRERTDGELLSLYVDDRDERAFAELVRRHERMVKNVCRHVLRHKQDAEDASQNTFLVLMRKADAIHERGGKIGAWLYGAACLEALNVRKSRRRRRQIHECTCARCEWGRLAQLVDEAEFRELQTLLDAALQRLPTNYRAPFVVCRLEGMSKAEAARQLDLPEGTVSSRLAKAREILQRGLAYYGVVLRAE